MVSHVGSILEGNVNPPQVHLVYGVIEVMCPRAGAAPYTTPG